MIYYVMLTQLRPNIENIYKLDNCCFLTSASLRFLKFSFLYNISDADPI